MQRILKPYIVLSFIQMNRSRFKIPVVSAFRGINKRNRRSIPCINLLFLIWCRRPDSNGYAVSCKGF